MAKKNLARSVIEGGRSKYYRDSRDLANRRTRRQFKLVQTCLQNNPELADDIDRFGYEAQIMNPFYDNKFSDKRIVIERWLRSRVGKRWDDVYSELRRKFDTRKTSDWHLIRGHLLNEVYNNGVSQEWVYGVWSRWATFYVDHEGILRASEWRK